MKIIYFIWFLCCCGQSERRINALCRNMDVFWQRDNIKSLILRFVPFKKFLTIFSICQNISLIWDENRRYNFNASKLENLFLSAIKSTVLALVLVLVLLCHRRKLLCSQGSSLHVLRRLGDHNSRILLPHHNNSFRPLLDKFLQR